MNLLIRHDRVVTSDAIILPSYRYFFILLTIHPTMGTLIAAQIFSQRAVNNGDKSRGNDTITLRTLS